VLGGVVLFCLLLPCLRAAEPKPVNLENLALIIDNIHNRYDPQHGDQFALAINVPEHYCIKKDFKPDKGFLKNDDPDTAKRAMKEGNMVYEGTSLIGATKKKKDNIMYHSEYLLLNPPDPKESPMTRLLKKNTKGCVVFYTYFSPCLGTCLNPQKGDFYILPALTKFGEHNGPKAFVFRKLYGEEKKDVFEKAFKKVNAEVPLIHCDNAVCNMCVDGARVKPECLPQKS
ncbi:hypothetical protein NFI96_018367, partial [Prochilodus magdalenae]